MSSPKRKIARHSTDGERKKRGRNKGWKVMARRDSRRRYGGDATADKLAARTQQPVGFRFARYVLANRYRAEITTNRLARKLKPKLTASERTKGDPQNRAAVAKINFAFLYSRVTRKSRNSWRNITCKSRPNINHRFILLFLLLLPSRREDRIHPDSSREIEPR